MPPVRVFISYSHDSEDHRTRVLELAQRLRMGGVDASIDRFADPPEGWRIWCEKEIARAELVLVICTEPYKRRAEGREEIGKGKGATYEAAVIGQAIYDGSMVNAKFLPVIFAGDEEQIPSLLKPVKRYELWDGYEQLYRRITGQPEVVPATIGEVKELPPLPAAAEPMPALATVSEGARAGAAGAPQQLWNVPFPRNPNFTGRADLLAALRKGFTDGASIGALTGMAGVGKTQAALEYVYRHRGDYQCIWWLRAEDPATLTGDLAALGIEAGAVPAATGDQRAALPAVRDWLEKAGDWLLVFDFAAGTAVVREHLPTGGKGHVLVTSRDPRWREIAQPHAVEELSREEAVALLQTRSGSQDAAGAAKVAEALGRLPLALVQAAAYVEETGGTFDDYLTVYAKHRESMLAAAAPADHPDNVTSTFRVALATLNEKSRAAVGLVQACAFLDPEGIPLSLFREQAERIGDELGKALADPLQFQAAVSAAIQLALIERAGETLTCNRMVQTVTRDELDEATRKELATGVLYLVAGAFPFEWKDIATWPPSQLIAPHVIAACGHTEALGVALPETGALLQRLGVYHHRRGLLPEARRDLERSLALLTRAHGTDEHVDVVAARHSLGQVLTAQGDFAAAREQLERAVAAVEKLSGPDHPDTGVSLMALADVYLSMGDRAGARTRFERALAIQLQAHGTADHEQVATALHELGRTLLQLNDYAAARDHLERSLAMQRRLWGEEHPESAATLQMLASALHAQGDLAGARERTERALAIKRKTLGEDHLDVATSLHYLGVILIAQGEAAAGRKALEDALAGKRKALGTDDNLEVAASLHTLGNVLLGEGDPAGARAHLEQALAIERKLLGDAASPAVANTLRDLARVLGELGDLPGARAQVEEGLAMLRKLAGSDDDLDIAASLHELGGITFAQGDLPAAKEQVERSLAILRKLLGTDEDLRVAASFHQLAAILHTQKDFAAAHAEIDRALAIKRKVLGTDEHPDVVVSLMALGAILHAEKDAAGARAQLERVLEIQTKLDGTRDRWSIALTEESLSNVLRAAGDQAGARPLLEHAHRICAAQLGPDHQHTKRIAAHLAALGS